MTQLKGAALLEQVIIHDDGETRKKDPFNKFGSQVNRAFFSITNAPFSILGRTWGGA